MQTRIYKIKIWSQVLDHYLPRISIITSHYGLLTTEILLPISSNQSSHQKQTEDRELDFSQFFIEYAENIKHQTHNEQTQSSRMMFSL